MIFQATLPRVVILDTKANQKGGKQFSLLKKSSQTLLSSDQHYKTSHTLLNFRFGCFFISVITSSFLWWRLIEKIAHEIFIYFHHIMANSLNSFCVKACSFRRNIYITACLHFKKEDAFLFSLNFTKLLPISTPQKIVHKIQYGSS